LTVAGDLFAQVVFFADPFEGNVLVAFDDEHSAEIMEDWAQEQRQRGGLVREGEQEVHATHLRIAQVIAGLSILPIVPFDLVGREIVRRGLADLGEEIFFGLFERQAERPRLASVCAGGSCSL